MIFRIEEIKNWLKNQTTIEEALINLTAENIVSFNHYDVKSGGLEKNDENLLKYEAFIGLTELKEHARKNGKEWLACNPRWISENSKIETIYDIIYWVNYGDGTTYGGFTVEDIKKWLSTPNLLLHTLGGTKER